MNLKWWIMRECGRSTGWLGITKCASASTSGIVSSRTRRNLIPLYLVPGFPQPSWNATVGRASYETRHARAYSCEMYWCTAFGTSPRPIVLWLFEMRCNLLLTAILRFKQKARDTTSTMTYEAPMMTALKFCVHDLFGAVLTACERRATHKIVKNPAVIIITRT